MILGRQQEGDKPFLATSTDNAPKYLSLKIVTTQVFRSQISVVRLKVHKFELAVYRLTQTFP
jgi:hypothetical protein